MIEHPIDHPDAEAWAKRENMKMQIFAKLIRWWRGSRSPLGDAILEARPELKGISSEPPEWFKRTYDEYLQSEEGQRLYGKRRGSK